MRVIENFEKQEKLFGAFKNEKLEGFGLITTFDNTTIFRGEFNNGKKNGFGELLGSQFKYLGNFKNSQFSGIGKIEKNNRYRGVCEWKESLKQGYGVLEYSNGDKYTGWFEKNDFWGFGIFEEKKKNLTYTGIFKYGKRAEFGKIENQSFQYIGEWDYDQRKGVGYYFEKNEKNFYFGEWRNNLQEGIGSAKNGSFVYRGEWKAGKPHGFGFVKKNGKEIGARFSSGNFMYEVDKQELRLASVLKALKMSDLDQFVMESGKKLQEIEQKIIQKKIIFTNKVDFSQLLEYIDQKESDLRAQITLRDAQFHQETINFKNEENQFSFQAAEKSQNFIKDVFRGLKTGQKQLQNNILRGLETKYDNLQFSDKKYDIQEVMLYPKNTQVIDFPLSSTALKCEENSYKQKYEKALTKKAKIQKELLKKFEEAEITDEAEGIKLMELVNMYKVREEELLTEIKKINKKNFEFEQEKKQMRGEFALKDKQIETSNQIIKGNDQKSKEMKKKVKEKFFDFLLCYNIDPSKIPSQDITLDYMQDKLKKLETEHFMKTMKIQQLRVKNEKLEKKQSENDKKLVSDKDTLEGLSLKKQDLEATLVSLKTQISKNLEILNEFEKQEEDKKRKKLELSEVQKLKFQEDLTIAKELYEESKNQKNDIEKSISAAKTLLRTLKEQKKQEKNTPEIAKENPIREELGILRANNAKKQSEIEEIKAEIAALEGSLNSNTNGPQDQNSENKNYSSNDPIKEEITRMELQIETALKEKEILESEKEQKQTSIALNNISNPAFEEKTNNIAELNSKIEDEKQAKQKLEADLTESNLELKKYLKTSSIFASGMKDVIDNSLKKKYPQKEKRSAKDLWKKNMKKSRRTLLSLVTMCFGTKATNQRVEEFFKTLPKDIEELVGSTEIIDDKLASMADLIKKVRKEENNQNSSENTMDDKFKFVDISIKKLEKSRIKVYEKLCKMIKNNQVKDPKGNKEQLQKWQQEKASLLKLISYLERELREKKAHFLAESQQQSDTVRTISSNIIDVLPKSSERKDRILKQEEIQRKPTKLEKVAQEEKIDYALNQKMLDLATPFLEDYFKNSETEYIQIAQPPNTIYQISTNGRILYAGNGAGLFVYRNLAFPELILELKEFEVNQLRCYLDGSVAIQEQFTNKVQLLGPGLDNIRKSRGESEGIFQLQNCSIYTLGSDQKFYWIKGKDKMNIIESGDDNIGFKEDNFEIKEFWKSKEGIKVAPMLLTSSKNGQKMIGYGTTLEQEGGVSQGILIYLDLKNNIKTQINSQMLAPSRLQDPEIYDFELSLDERYIFISGQTGQKTAFLSILRFQGELSCIDTLKMEDKQVGCLSNIKRIPGTNVILGGGYSSVVVAYYDHNLAQVRILKYFHIGVDSNISIIQFFSKAIYFVEEQTGKVGVIRFFKEVQMRDYISCGKKIFFF